VVQEKENQNEIYTPNKENYNYSCVKVLIRGREWKYCSNNTLDILKDTPSLSQ
jgi:hypothetical protein